MEANMQPHKLTMLPVSAEYYSSSDGKTKQQLLEENTEIVDRLVSARKSKEEAKAKETVIAFLMELRNNEGGPYATHFVRQLRGHLVAIVDDKTKDIWPIHVSTRF